MIKKYNQFIREFVENGNYIDAKMQELKDLVDNVTNGQNIIYEWENKSDHELVVSFSTDNLSIKYDFDIDDLLVTKTAGGTIDFQTNVESIDEGLEMIEKDIQSILGISESKMPKKIHKPKNVKKEIFKGEKQYRKDWEDTISKKLSKK
jgi:hypothetical protein